jgi:hypothetical protein
VSIDQLESKILRARRASLRSRQTVAAAYEELDDHHRWLDRHRATWAEAKKRHQRRLNYKLGIWALKRVAWGIFLVGPIVLVALFRLIAQWTPRLRALFLNSVAWLNSRARAKRMSSLSHGPVTKHANRSHYCPRISGLDGPLCTAQPASLNTITRTANTETPLLYVRLSVASFVAVGVGALAATITTFDEQKEPAGLPIALIRSGQEKSFPPSVSSHQPAPERSKPKRILGFAVLAGTPAVERVPYRGMTIADMMSIARPLTVTKQSDVTEPLEVTLPARKPKTKIKVRSKRNPVKQKPQLTLWDQLPWLRLR